MLDYLLRFPSEPDARRVIPQYWIQEPRAKTGVWDEASCIPNVQVYRVLDAEQDTRELFPGWWIVISDPGPAIITSLQNLPNNVCRLIADRDAATEEDPAIIYLAPDFDPANLEDTRVEPLFAGSNYPFS